MVFPFFDLPRELRDEIYHFLFLSSAEQPDATIRLTIYRLKLRHSVDKAMFHASSKLRQEAMHLLFDCFTIRYTHLLRNEKNDLDSFCDRIPQTYISMIRHFEIDLRVGLLRHPFPYPSQVNSAGRDIVDRLPQIMPQLRTLRARIWFTSAGFMEVKGPREGIVEVGLDKLVPLLQHVQNFQIDVRTSGYDVLPSLGYRQAFKTELRDRLLEKRKVELWTSSRQSMPSLWYEKEEDDVEVYDSSSTRISPSHSSDRDDPEPTDVVGGIAVLRQAPPVPPKPERYVARRLEGRPPVPPKD